MEALGGVPEVREVHNRKRTIPLPTTSEDFSK